MLAASVLGDEPPTPEELLIEQERRQRGREAIASALAAMPERARRCVRGVFYEERSLGDLARELGVTERTVAREMAAARKRFESALRTRGGDSVPAR